MMSHATSFQIATCVHQTYVILLSRVTAIVSATHSFDQFYRLVYSDSAQRFVCKLMTVMLKTDDGLKTSSLIKNFTLRLSLIFIIICSNITARILKVRPLIVSSHLFVHTCHRSKAEDICAQPLTDNLHAD